MFSGLHDDADFYSLTLISRKRIKSTQMVSATHGAVLHEAVFD